RITAVTVWTPEPGLSPVTRPRSITLPRRPLPPPRCPSRRFQATTIRRISTVCTPSRGITGGPLRQDSITAVTTSLTSSLKFEWVVVGYWKDWSDVVEGKPNRFVRQQG